MARDSPQAVSTQPEFIECRQPIEGAVVDAFDQVVVQDQDPDERRVGERRPLDGRYVVPSKLDVVDGRRKAARDV